MLRVGNKRTFTQELLHSEFDRRRSINTGAQVLSHFQEDFDIEVKSSSLLKIFEMFQPHEAVVAKLIKFIQSSPLNGWVA